MPVATTNTLMDANGYEKLVEFVIGPGLGSGKNRIDRVHVGGYERYHLEALNAEVALKSHMVER
jgi:hypothetical protein